MTVIDSKKETRGIGTYAAQGAAANSIAIYLALLSLVLYHPTGDDIFVILVIFPFYLVFTSIKGAIVGALFWLATFLIGERKIRFLTRVIVGILLPILIAFLLALIFTSEVEVFDLAYASIWLLLIVLPAALMSGSRFNPLRSVVFGLDDRAFVRDFGNLFSFPPALLLRVGSLLGLMESMLWLASLPSSALANWGMSDEQFLHAMAAVMYFGVTALVSYGLPRKFVVLIAALLANLPLGVWAIDSQRYLTATSQFFAYAAWVFISLWALFVVGRMLGAETAGPRRLRILPITMMEIRMRHALNYW